MRLHTTLEEKGEDTQPTTDRGNHPTLDTRIERILELTDLPSEPLEYTSAEFEELVRARNPFILRVLREEREL